MKKKLKFAVLSALAFGFIAFGLFYTRPLTIEQRYPFLDFSKCIQIRGYLHSYGDDSGEIEDQQFIITPDQPHFEQLIASVRSAEFKTELSNLLPDGTKFHRYEDGDFKWNVTMRFDDTEFPNGEISRGDFLRIENFFGDLELHFGGENIDCTVSDKQQWVKDIMDIISLYVVEKQ